MTIATTNTEDFEVDRLLKRAAQTAGLMSLEQAATGTQWNARAAYGRDQLDLVLKKLPAGCPFTRNVEFHTITLAEGDGAEATPLTLDADTITLSGIGMYREDADASESQVRQVSREEWQESNDKNADPGTPTRMYVDKGATISVYLLPPAGTAGATLRVQRVKFLADARPGDRTLDVERHWLDYLHFEIAARYALSMGYLEKYRALRGEAQAEIDKTRAASSSTVSIEMSFDHEHGW